MSQFANARAYSPAGERFLRALLDEERADAQRQREWRRELAERGIIVAHPDDGWVDRERDTVTFCYPSMQVRTPQPGDLVALGRPEEWRLVRLVTFTPWRLRLRGDEGTWTYTREEK